MNLKRGTGSTGVRLPTMRTASCAGASSAARSQRATRWRGRSCRCVPSANCSDGYAEVAPVGSFQPNRFGLYDMVGNVSEWLSDCFPDSLEHPERGDPCYRRGSRGGSWRHPPLPYRVGFPSRGRPYTTTSIFGFRVARDMP